MLRAVRERQPDHPIHIDCNSAYRPADLPLFQEIDDFRLAMIEQPLAHDDLVDHAALQAQISTPICLDESIGHPDHARHAVALKSCGFINVKPARVGGLTNAVAIHDLCREAGMPCWVGGMIESSTGAAVCAALAMLDNFSYPADIFPSRRFYHEDLAQPAFEIQRSSDGVPVVRAPESIPEPESATTRDPLAGKRRSQIRPTPVRWATLPPFSPDRLIRPPRRMPHARTLRPARARRPRPPHRR